MIMSKMLLSGLCATVAVFAGEPAIQALESLRKGNEAFRAEKTDVTRFGRIRRLEVATGQHPVAAVLSCADSRVAPELIFGQGLGDLFVVRTAGAVPDRAVLGSLEYAVEHLHVPVVVVVGHLSCGAVKAAMEPPPAHAEAVSLNLEHILAAIRPALERTKPHGGPWVNAVYASVEVNLDDVLRLSPVLSEQLEAGKIAIRGAVYELESGKVIFLEPSHSHSHASSR